MSVQSGPSTVAPRFAPVRCSFRLEDTYSGGPFASSKPCGTAAAKRLAPPTFVAMSHAVEAPGPQICLNYVRRHGQNGSTSMRQDTGPGLEASNCPVLRVAVRRGPLGA